MERALKWLERPIQLFMWIGLFGGLAMMLHVTADVAGRAFFRPLIGTTEIVSGYYMILIAYLPWAGLSRTNGHITVELFAQFFPAAINRFLDFAVHLLTIAYVGVFTWQTWLRAGQQMNAGESLQVGGGTIYVWPSRYVLPLAGGLMVVYLVLRVIDDFMRLRTVSSK